jgi:hypothetical protein
LHIAGQKDLRGLAVCEETHQVFVADHTAKCIWRVKNVSKENYSVDKFIPETPFKPWGLSVTSRQLLITYDDEKALYIHSVSDGVQQQRIPLQFSAYHAIESKVGTFFVCHQVENANDGRLHSVSEIDEEGKVIKTYEGEKQLNKPRAVAMGPEDKLLVADHFNKRVAVLSQELKFQDEVNYAEHVNRVFFVHGTNQLLVGLEDHGVDIMIWPQPHPDDAPTSITTQ